MIGKRVRKLNHKGMTLVEVIVAMAILAVVIAPALRMFAHTSNTNFRARQRQRATTVAEATMETMKAYSLADLCEEFRSGTFPGVVSKSGVTTMTAQALQADGVTWGTPFRTDDTLNTDFNEYKLRVENAYSEDIPFDVEVKVTPKHSDDVLHINSPSEYADCIIVLEEGMNEDAKGDFVGKATAQLTTEVAGMGILTVESADLKDFVRKIELTVDGSDVAQTVSMSVTYTGKVIMNYKLDGASRPAKTYGSYEYKVNLSTTPGVTEETRTYYDNSGTIGGYTMLNRKCKLERIYLYYFPTYSKVFGEGAKDVITVNATVLGDIYRDMSSSMTEGDARAAGIYPLELIVNKQCYTSVTNYFPGPALWRQAEESYNRNPDVSLVCNVASGGGQMVLTHNLDDYIGEEDITAPIMNSIVPTGFGRSEDIKTGVVDNERLLYNVEVHVFNAGTTEEVAMITGTMND